MLKWTHWWRQYLRVDHPIAESVPSKTASMTRYWRKWMVRVTTASIVKRWRQHEKWLSSDRWKRLITHAYSPSLCLRSNLSSVTIWLWFRMELQNRMNGKVVMRLPSVWSCTVSHLQWWSFWPVIRECRTIIDAFTNAYLVSLLRD